ncbi:MAG: hypothetical protein IJA76_04550 [Clostridia bacterium]|nr:hypothetical protein [Clostridia bacterium]MBQ6883215.1 hypothetical protein [Clostridia bacterium]
MEKKCPNCEEELIEIVNYHICENCKIAIPSSKENLKEILQQMDYLRKERRDFLYKLEQKEMSKPNELLPNEKTEINIWEQHNELYINLNFWLKSYDVSSDVRLREVYPRIYDYLIIVQKIKNFYEKTNKERNKNG